jgi:TolB-like protein
VTPPREEPGVTDTTGVGAILEGRYRLDRKLGRGGMGRVFAGHDLRIDRRVAVKLLSGGLRDVDSLKRFAQEARTAGSLDHPNVLAVFDVGSHDGTPYLVSQLLAGATLRSRMGGPVPEDDVVGLALQLADGLAAAHEKGIVHRDLKPENLFLTREGRLKILDFGIAKLTQSPRAATDVPEAPTTPHTATGAIMGTIGYMSPEQVRGTPVDVRSDIFSAGVILYELLDGRAPFRGGAPVEAGYAVLRRTPPTPPGSAHIAHIVERCLEKDPDRRYGNGSELLAALRDLPAVRTPVRLRGELVDARADVFALGATLYPANPAERPASGQAVREELLVLDQALETEGRDRRVVRTSTPARSTTLRFVLMFAGIAATIGAGVYIAATRGRSAITTDGTAPATGALPSVAVLPFADLSSGKDQAYFADGVAEEIRTALANLPGLRVVGRSSSAAFKGRADYLEALGEKLGVAHVVEGSLRKDGNRVRVTAEIIRLADTRVLWSQSYDRNLTGLLEVQDEIANAVVGALRVKLLPSAAHAATTAVRHPEAYQQFLLGRALVLQSTDESNVRAITVLERALKLDADLAPAHAWLSYVCWNLTWVTRGEERLALARRGRLAADRAVAVAPTYSTGYSARGYWRMGDDWDWAGAQRDFERAVELGPGDETALNGLATLMMALGRLDEGVKLRRRAVEMDPLDVAHIENLADDLLRVGALEEAREMARRAMEILPDSYYSQSVLSEADLLDGKFQAALERFRRLPPHRRLVGIAAAAFSAGQDQVSLATLAELERDRAGRAFEIAAVYSWRGDADGAFRWLERAYQERDRNLFSIKNSYLFRRIRADPRYTALLGKMNLPGD